MGYLFASMEHMSIQEERRKTEEQRRKTEEERRKTEEQRRRAEEAEEQLAKAKEEMKAEIKADIIDLLREIGAVSEELEQRLSGQEDMELLRKWHRLAARAHSIEEFMGQAFGFA